MYQQITIEEATLVQESKRVFCRRCGRELKSRQAKELGFGITCYRKYMKECLRSTRKHLFNITQEN